MTAPDHLPSAEYKQQCGECGAVTSLVDRFCPTCGEALDRRATGDE